MKTHKWRGGKKGTNWGELVLDRKDKCHSSARVGRRAKKVSNNPLLKTGPRDIPGMAQPFCFV